MIGWQILPIDKCLLYLIWGSALPGCVLCLVTQSCPTLCSPWTEAQQAPLSMRILQARVLQWVPMPSSSGSSQHRDRTQTSCTAGGFFTI